MNKIIINRNKCEGKATCLKVCPENVFELAEPKEGISFITRFKLRVHGRKQAHVVNEEACTACMKCVEMCTENALQINP